MKFINKPRRSGKTYGLIYASEATGFPIVVTTADRYNNIVGMATAMGCDIPDPILVRDMRDRAGYRPQDCFIDDAEDVIAQALREYLHSNVHGVTVSLDMKSSLTTTSSKESSDRHE